MAGVLLVCMAAGLWGTVGVAIALVSTGNATDPAAMGLMRTVLGAASLLLAAWVLRLPRPTWTRVPKWPLAIFGVAGAIFQACLLKAFQEVGVTVTVAVTVCAPVLMVAAVDAVWQRRPPERRIALGIFAGSAGVLLVLPEMGQGRQVSPLAGTERLSWQAPLPPSRRLRS